jgi:hypothetical protein
MTYEEGQHVRVDCVGPNHVQATGLLHSAFPVRFTDGYEGTVFIFIADNGVVIQGRENPMCVVGDGEIVERLEDYAKE